MCGACPGGAGISRLSAYAGLTGIKPRVAALLQDAAGGRVGIKAFGDRWVLRSRTGAQHVVPGLEDVAAAVVTRPLDWDAVAALTGTPITGTAPHLACPASAALQQVAEAPLHGPQPDLSAGEFAAALLVRAANTRG